MREFLLMHGYAAYIWPSYGMVAFLLFIQWYIPHRRLKHYLKQLQHHESN